MKIEVWYDFNDESYEQIKAIDKLISDFKIDNLELLYRSYPLSYGMNIKAHQISHLAKKYYCQHEFILNLFKKLENDDLSLSLIKEAALEEFLDEDQVDNILNSSEFEEQVFTNKENAIYKKILIIPHTRFQGKYKLNGFNNLDALIYALEKTKTNYQVNEHCEGEHCGRKKSQKLI